MLDKRQMIDKYKQGFQDEARELLQELESSLLALSESPEDSELVGRAFRALHTIKGSGAMFGFDDVSAFTHHIENAFDRVRNGRLEATAELISLALSAGDQIKAMMDQSAGQGEANPSVGAEILKKLRDLTGEVSVPANKRSESIESFVPANTVPGGMRKWHIKFSPGPDMLRQGASPLLLFRELRDLGSLDITADSSAIPNLVELDPQRCFVTWDMVLTSDYTVDAIRDVFIFVEDSCELSIEAQADLPQINIQSTDVPVERRTGEVRRAEDQNRNASSIRVSAAKLDQLLDIVGQLVTAQARLGEIASCSDNHNMLAIAEEVETLTNVLRETSMSMRTLPVRATFERFKRLVYDLGRTLHKEVDLTFEGGDTELDKTVIDQLNDPLMHLIRNSMDHGIEEVDIRKTSGKPAKATIHLSARHDGAQVVICVSDDGKGINRDAVRARAIEKGLIATDARLSDSEVYSLILAPGFSTAREITDVSGRGVGMDVVRRNVEALRGSLEISSQSGTGTTIALRLPLTLAIIDGLLVRVGDTRFIMPRSNTVECVELTRKDIENANGKHLANIRGEIVPYIRLGEYLHLHTERPEREQVMIADTEHGKFGFVVDQVLGDHQTVIKSLGRLYHGVQDFSGATILGDGTVALILDLHRLVQNAIRSYGIDSLARSNPVPASHETQYETATVQ